MNTEYTIKFLESPVVSLQIRCECKLLCDHLSDPKLITELNIQ